jgi:hypothetical protein
MRIARMLRIGSYVVGFAMVLAAVALAVFTPAGRAYADGGASPVTINVTVPNTLALTCVDNAGGGLGAHPVLHRHDAIVCTGTGFTAGEQVDFTVDSSSTVVGTVTADANGIAKLTVTIADSLSADVHKLIATGRTSHASASFAFTVAVNSAGGVGGGGGSPGGLAFTGVAIGGLVIGGLALVATGGVLTAANRRRRHT